MTITASCGHKVDDIDDLHNVSVREYARDWSNAVSYKSVCQECLDWNYKQNLLLKNEKEELEWLS